MKESADRILTQAVKEGDPESWNQLVSLYSGRLFAFAVKELGHRTSDAEDLVQETFLTLIKEARKPEEIRSLEAFLFLVLRRRIIDFRRRRKADHLTESTWQKRLISPGETPSHRASMKEEASRSKKALADALGNYLDSLKDSGQYKKIAALELTFLTERSGKHIAEKLGFSTVQISRIKQTALDSLRSQVSSFAPLEQASLTQLWEENLFTCLKRSTLGAYELDLLSPDLKDYVDFHLEELSCPYCQAKLEDMKQESAKLPELKQRILATSTPFLRRKD